MAIQPLSASDLQKYLPRMISVVNVGKQLKGAGAHYLWGAQGDGTPNILADRTGPADADTFMRCATLWAGNPGSGVCAGRSGAADVISKPVWDKKDPRATGALFRWPRYFIDTSTDNSPKVNGGRGQVVWGEDCNGKKHFDCAGFVRHCFRSVLGSGIIPTQGLLMRSVAQPVWSAGSQPLTSLKLYPADLLYDAGYTHVGIATGDVSLASAGVSDPGNVLHCYSATVGVMMTPLTQYVQWKYVYRWTKWS